MTFGHGREFVNSTFFKWTDKMGNGFYKMILQQGGVCWCQLFYIASMALGCFLGYTFTSMTSLLAHNVAHSKGQLILKCPFGAFKSSQKTQKIFQDFCPSL